MHVTAAFIGTAARRTLNRAVDATVAGDAAGSVIAQFERCVYVAFENDDGCAPFESVVCIANGELGRNPLTVSLDRRAPSSWAVAAPVDTPANRDLRDLTIGTALRICWADAECVHRYARAEAAPASERITNAGRGVQLLPNSLAQAPGLSPQPIQRAARPAVAALRRWLRHPQHPPENPPAAVSKLVGLGAGLTPAGDDFLIGVFAALQFFGVTQHAAILAAALTPRLVKNTNRISAAYLHCAITGAHSAALTALLRAIDHGECEAIAHAIATLDGIGQSSGRDALAGVLTAIDAMTFSAANRDDDGYNGLTST